MQIYWLAAGRHPRTPVSIQYLYHWDGQRRL